MAKKRKKKLPPEKTTMSNLEKPQLITFSYTKKGSGLKYSFNGQKLNKERKEKIRS